MKTHLFILLFLFLIYNVSRAQLSFFKVITFHNYTTGYGIQEVDSGNFICSASDQLYRPFPNNSYLTGLLSKLNSGGDTIKNVFIGCNDSVSYSTWGNYSSFVFNTLHLAADHNLLATGSIGNSSDMLIMKINQELDTIWTRNFVNQNYSSRVSSSTLLSNQELVCVGERVFYLPYNNKSFFCKLDSSGNILVDHTYQPDPPFFRIIPEGICQMSNGGFSITGIQIHSNNRYLPFYMITDSMGNEIQRFSLPIDTVSENQIGNIIQTKDSNNVFCWLTPDTNSGQFSVLHLSKIDPTGNLLWTKNYDANFYSYFSIKELQSGRLAIYGSIQDTIAYRLKGLLIIADSSGQPLSTKKYSDNISDWSVLSGNLTSDGEMIFCGSAHTSSNNSGLLVYKTDSLGYLISIGKIADEFAKGIHWKDIYPNPSTGIVHLDLNIELKERYKKIMLDVYDLQSRRKLSVPLQKGRTEQELDLSGFESGTYVMVLAVDDFKGAVKRVVIQH